MEIRLTPEIEAHLKRLALDSRYEGIRTGCVRPMDRETFFEGLCRREEALLRGGIPPMTAVCCIVGVGV